MLINMYDEHETTSTRFVGFVGDHRWDLAITKTEHFYGKSLVVNIQSGRAGIIGHDDLEDEKLHLLANMFALDDEDTTVELRNFLLTNL
ncbi:DUF3055 domain-containing protein [Tumebacillus flagellatus]|nr:DUF3055 domain-containing protein [Tumebacillus flagellatus]